MRALGQAYCVDAGGSCTSTASAGPLSLRNGMHSVRYFRFVTTTDSKNGQMNTSQSRKSAAD